MIDQRIYKYCEEHSSPEGKLLGDLVRQTNLRVVNPRMLSGHLQGQFLSMLVRFTGSKSVLELGTFTGYSSICMAGVLPSDGRLVTIEIDDELEDFAREFFDRAGLAEVIEQRIGDAVEVLVEMIGQQFDMVFMDADKRQYCEYYHLLFEHGLVGSGSLIVADNTLWAGKVVEDNHPQKDKQTYALLEFNDMVAADPRVEKVLLPLRDGLTLIRVK